MALLYALMKLGLIDDKINNYEVSIDGYDLVRKGRKRTGGGVAMYIRTQYAIKLDKT